MFVNYFLMFIIKKYIFFVFIEYTYSKYSKKEGTQQNVPSYTVLGLRQKHPRISGPPNGDFPKA